MTHRVVIVGATGQIGRPLCRELVRAGHAVTVFSRDPARAGHLVPGPLGQQAALSARHHGVRTVVLRTGYVLTRDSLASHAPEPAQARQFARSPGHVASHRAWLPVPTPLVRMGLGVVTDILVRGKRVIPAKASAVRYQFTFPVLETALHNLVPGGPGA